jgi:hypothetical protein
MKSKIIILGLTAITLLSFTLISKKSPAKAETKVEQSQKGFALQDNDQF